MNEEGTEAAAATGIIMMNRAMPIEENYEFTADHPFAFSLVTNKNEVLFNGIFQG
jgi:serine protease inhibitor